VRKKAEARTERTSRSEAVKKSKIAYEFFGIALQNKISIRKGKIATCHPYWNTNMNSCRFVT
jgi:hypothetical protein